jgi:hypothetical protein
MSTNADNEMTGTSLDSIEVLDKIGHGEHIILVYSNLNALREIYSHYCNIALKNKGISIDTHLLSDSRVYKANFERA